MEADLETVALSAVLPLGAIIDVLSMGSNRADAVVVVSVCTKPAPTSLAEREALSSSGWRFSRVTRSKTPTAYCCSSNHVARSM